MKLRILFVVMLAVLLGSVVLGGLVPLIGPAQAAPMLAGEDGSRDTITPTLLSAAGIDHSTVAASGDGQRFRNTGRDIVLVTNGYTDTITLTVVTGGQLGGWDIEDVDIAVGAGETAIAGPFPPTIFNQTSGSEAGRVHLDWNGTVTGTVANSVTLAVYRVP